MTTAVKSDEGQNIAEAVARLRVLVLAAGEAAQSQWWRTQLMSETGMRFLERLYPRTVLSAAIHAASSAAREVHDQAVGRRRAYHLFRLPEHIEAAIRARINDGSNQLQDLRKSLGDMQGLLSEFNKISGESSGKAEGPVRMGAAKTLKERQTVERMAGLYLTAFSRGRQVFPFFETESDGDV
jgi:hypothetical protein